MKLLIVIAALLAVFGGGFYGYNQDYYGGRGFGGGIPHHLSVSAWRG